MAQVSSGANSAFGTRSRVSVYPGGAPGGVLLGERGLLVEVSRVVISSERRGVRESSEREAAARGGRLGVGGLVGFGGLLGLGTGEGELACWKKEARLRRCRREVEKVLLGEEGEAGEAVEVVERDWWGGRGEMLLVGGRLWSSVRGVSRV